MFRTTATRSLTSLKTPAARAPLGRLVQQAAYRSSTRQIKYSPILALTTQQPIQKSLVRYVSSKVVLGRDNEREAALQKEKVFMEPELVTTSSTAHPVLSGEVGGREEPEQDVDMMAGIKSDFKTIVDTFSLNNVPQKAMYMGLAGVLPYLATSMATVILSFDIQYNAHHGQGLLFNGEVAEQLLHIIEPLQLGYGATIISFLGAIHWGLEWAGFGGEQGYKRYAIGVVATAVAWPTLLLSAEVGLITQFLAFTFLYYTDVRAARAGWAPRWYGIYRFVLTFVVGASIVASLIGRGQIADLVSKPDGPAARLRALRERQLQELEDGGGEYADSDEEEEEEE